ncbi:MAG TPA: orotidine-5'-phosphate decarboxylase [Mycobacteriales bacterium]|jgi:orotidine-5'-phosphate decarboxylase|nr:orotidine-5'-phosphate decarboxylase [Mycobacteriales bacterium]
MPSHERSPIAVALDTGDLATATRWAQAVAPHVSTVKVGLELFCAEGPSAVEKIRATAEVDLFLDLKLHDIPATVGGAARSVAPLAPDYLTVHACGGPAVIAAAAEALPATRITAITILTSLSAADLDLLGIAGPPADAVVRLARLAVDAGARALVCSPQEVALVRAAVGDGVRLITPGVRPAGAATHDQARVAAPEQAIADGADLVVIGRPITGATEPGEAAAAIAATLSGR